MNNFKNLIQFFSKFLYSSILYLDLKYEFFFYNSIKDQFHMIYVLMDFFILKTNLH